VEDNLAFEKGVTSLDVNLEKNIVTIEYKPWKNDSIHLRKSIEKLGYTAVLLPMEVKDKGKEQKEK
jgi:periplasmic mercuric ion binding protein